MSSMSMGRGLMSSMSMGRGLMSSMSIACGLITFISSTDCASSSLELSSGWVLGSGGIDVVDGVGNGDGYNGIGDCCILGAIIVGAAGIAIGVTL